MLLFLHKVWFLSLVDFKNAIKDFMLKISFANSPHELIHDFFSCSSLHELFWKRKFTPIDLVPTMQSFLQGFQSKQSFNWSKWSLKEMNGEVMKEKYWNQPLTLEKDKIAILWLNKVRRCEILRGILKNYAHWLVRCWTCIIWWVWLAGLWSMWIWDRKDTSN